MKQLFALTLLISVGLTGFSQKQDSWQEKLVSEMLPVILNDGSILYVQRTEFPAYLMDEILGLSVSEGNWPVVDLSYDQVDSIINIINEQTGLAFRLPTNEEWIQAAGGNTNLYSGSDLIEEVGWYKKNSGGVIHPCCQLKPNSFGLFDMTGNVIEMARYVDATDDFTVALMGGAGVSKKRKCRNSYFMTTAPETATSAFGFRLVTQSLDK